MSFEEEFKHIDFEIRKLKVQYDLYFFGSAPRPPNDQKESLARQLRKYQGTSFPNLADRFLYNNIVNKFNTFQELWTKMLRIKEEGARVHPLAVRAARRAMRSETGGTSGPIPPPGAEPGRDGDTGRISTRTSHGNAPGSTEGGAASPPPAVWRVAPGSTDPSAVRALYESFVAARRQCGDTRLPAFESFAREVARHAEAIKGKARCSSVEFRIYSADNKVTLRARPAGEDKGKG